LAAEVPTAPAALLRVNLEGEVARGARADVYDFADVVALCSPALEEDEEHERADEGAGHEEVAPLLLPGGRVVLIEVDEVELGVVGGDDAGVHVPVGPHLVLQQHGVGRVDVHLVVDGALAEDVDVGVMERLVGGVGQGLQEPLLLLDGHGDDAHQQEEH